MFVALVTTQIMGTWLINFTFTKSDRILIVYENCPIFYNKQNESVKLMSVANNFYFIQLSNKVILS